MTFLSKIIQAENKFFGSKCLTAQMGYEDLVLMGLLSSGFAVFLFSSVQLVFESEQSRHLSRYKGVINGQSF